jgi:hypothetical protein
VFENSVQSSNIGIEPTIETLRSNTSAAAEKVVRKALSAIGSTPFVKTYVGGIAPVWFSTVRESLICIDDFERRGNGLDVRDVLGLINQLKEQKACKVCLILNENALGDGEIDFRKYLEKVVDITLKFSPSPQECARIALNRETTESKLLAEDCITLGISNIRLIKRIERMVLMIEPQLREFNRGVLQQAVHSLTLLGWSTYEPDLAPSLDFLKMRRGRGPFGVDNEVSKEDATWNALLDTYRFSDMDEFDLVLLDGVQNGFFDPSRVRELAAGLSKRFDAATVDNSFKEAWDRYHDSFDDDQNQVLDAMYESFINGIPYISPTNMNATVALFKTLGRQGQAAELIARYVQGHRDDSHIFDLRNYPFAEDLTDPDVVQAFKDKFATFNVGKTPASILLYIANTNGWNPVDITTLSVLPVDEYRKIFKDAKGQDLRKIINACLQFDRINNASSDMKEVSKRAKEALTLIGQESGINARRVAKYGIKA